MKHLFKKVQSLYYKLPFAFQIVLTIILVFVSFFMLQLILNLVFFRNHFIRREIELFEDRLSSFTDELRTLESDNYFDALYEFTSNNNAFTILLGNELEILEATYPEYSLLIFDLISEEYYDLLITDIEYPYVERDNISLSITEGPGNFYLIQSVENGDNTDSFLINGHIVEIRKPNHLNFLYRYHPLVMSNTSGIINNKSLIDEITLDTYYSQVSLEDSLNTAVFITKINEDTYLLTLFIIQDLENIITTVSSYQNYVYLTAIVIIILWSFRIGPMISTPIKKIEGTAKRIALLDFDTIAEEYTNKETSSLSDSINLISKNLRSTIDTINNKNDELMKLYAYQSEQVNLKKQLVSAISHELKTPLMIMQATAQAILDGVVPKSEQENELINLIEEVNKSAVMIQDLLQIYRLDEKEKLENEPINISRLTHDFLQNFQNLILKQKLNLDLEIEHNVTIYGDEKLIKRVISNFLINAINYTPINESITVKVYIMNNCAHFETINTGTFIDDKHLKNIWMPFYRIDNDKQGQLQTRGSGIGLYLVSEVLDAHNFEYDLINTEEGVKAYFIAKAYLDFD